MSDGASNENAPAAFREDWQIADGILTGRGQSGNVYIAFVDGEGFVVAACFLTPEQADRIAGQLAAHAIALRGETRQ